MELLTIGRNKDKSFTDVYANDKGYCDWIVKNGPFKDKSIIKFESFCRERMGLPPLPPPLTSESKEHLEAKNILSQSKAQWKFIGLCSELKCGSNLGGDEFTFTICPNDDKHQSEEESS